MLTSIVERDHVAAPSAESPLAAFAHALSEAGLSVVEHRPALAADVEASGSAWAKRLGIPSRRPAWLLVARSTDFDQHALIRAEVDAASHGLTFAIEPRGE